MTLGIEVPRFPDPIPTYPNKFDAHKRWSSHQNKMQLAARFQFLIPMIKLYPYKHHIGTTNERKPRVVFERAVEICV